MEATFLQGHLEVEGGERESGEQYVIFSLGDTECAVRVEGVQGIERMPEITRVPRTPGWIEGVANLRGNIITIIDFRSFMGLARKTPSRTSHVVVSKAGEVIMGLLVDRVSEIRYLKSWEIRSPIADTHGGLTSYLRGIYPLGDRLISVIDLTKVLLSRRMRDLGPSSSTDGN